MLTLIIQGIMIGSIYGMIAMALTIVFGVMRVINFAHGASFMVAMYLTYLSVTLLKVNNYAALLLTGPLMFLYGYLIFQIFIRPVLNKEANVRNPIGALVLTYGLSVVIENSFLWAFGANYHTISVPFANQMVRFGNICTIALPRIIAFLIAGVVTVVFYIFLQKTEKGRIIRAVGQDREAASLMGVNFQSTFSLSYGLSMIILAIAAVAMLPFFSVHPSMGSIFSIRALCTVLLGGLGSIHGAIIGGLIIGVIECCSTMFVPTTLANMVVYAAFLIFLFIRPSGLFGSKYES
jgi:branched-chain amino acid transport system permease protein